VTAILELQGVRKSYSGLRPLRMDDLHIAEGERVAISGLDAAAAELFVNLVTGAAVPDQGTVRAFGRSTADIVDGEAWLVSLEQFGIVSPRAVLLEEATIEQNLAMPFTLQIDPVPVEVVEQVRSLAAQSGLDAGTLAVQAGAVTGVSRARVHLARAAALAPKMLVLEHPTLDVAEADRKAFGRDVARVAEARGLAAVAVTMDLDFAEAFAHRSLALEAATGALRPWKRKRGWFG
jgi:ABC-type lipoprotein export system ATPase subunit